MELIDRSKAIEELNIRKDRAAKYGRHYERDVIEDCIDVIEDAPSAQEWIPVSERLPEAEYVLAQYQDGLMAVLIGDRIPMWNIVNQPKPIVAWMLLPEPYREDKE